MIKGFGQTFTSILFSTQAENLNTAGSKRIAEDHKSIHVLVSVLHGLGGEAHVLEHFCVSVGILQSFSLIFDGGQGAVDLSQLLLITLLPLEGLEGSLRKKRTSI